MLQSTLFPLQRVGRPPEPIVRAADVEGPYRWSLTRRWGDGPLLPMVGCNPSRADSEIDDPTIVRGAGFAWRWGYSGLLMLNRYPFIASKMKDLHWWLANGGVHERKRACYRNDVKIRDFVRHQPVVMAVWGNLVPADDIREWLFWFAAQGIEINWFCLGTTGNGAPKHPMARGKHRIPDDAKPAPWRAR